MKKLDKYNAVNWKEFVYYDETSPTFLRWKVDRWSGKDGLILKRSAGDVAGYIDTRNYASTSFTYKLYRNHRIIWVLFHGWIDPELQVDHIDGNKSNNKIENLRLVTRAVNLRNKEVQCNNSTGVNGVSLTNDGDGHYYYTASWCTIYGKLKQKCFSITKLGEAESFSLACEYRTGMIEELNKQGAGYTERHGT